MGITLYGKYHGEYSPFSLNMGYGTFFRLRCAVCKNFNLAFYEHYKTMKKILGASEAEKTEWDKKTERLIQYYKLDNGNQKKILDFLFELDLEGSATYGACKEIYELVKNEPDNDIYGYTGYGENCSKMSDFKKLLLDIYQNKGKLIWN